jgi:3-hydroxyacyl-[acyl-carrier-protein] dehydratase
MGGADHNEVRRDNNFRQGIAMRFLMVDRICELEHAAAARGIKNISWDDDFLDEYVPGIPVYSPVLLAEAVAQLVSWIIIEAKDFTAKPVITVLDSYSCSGHPRPGDRLELAGSLESLSPESALAHGRVFLNGRPIIELSHAVCFLYPLAELDPPERARLQFKNLYVPGSPLPAAQAASAGAAPEEKFVRRRRWIDRILETGDAGRLLAVKNVTATDDCFNDHFPLKPVLPGVAIMEAQNSLARDLAQRELAGLGTAGVYPVLSRAEKVKFRMFIQPGDQMLLEASVKSISEGRCSIATKVTVEGKNAASGLLHYDLQDRSAYIKNYLGGA